MCVKFSGRPKLNILMCLMHFGEWGKKRLKKFDKGWTFFSFFFKFGFENHLKSWTYMSHYKNYFSNDFTENFSRIFQKFYFFRIRLIKSIFQPIKMWRRKSVFQLKVSGPFDSFRPIKPFFMYISIPNRFLSNNWISIFKSI